MRISRHKNESLSQYSRSTCIIYSKRFCDEQHVLSAVQDIAHADAPVM